MKTLTWQTRRTVPRRAPQLTPEQWRLQQAKLRNGEIPPLREGFFTEFGQGVALTVVRDLGCVGFRSWSQQVLSTHRHWGAYPGYRLGDWSRSGLGRTGGLLCGQLCFWGLPVLLVALVVRWRYLRWRGRIADQARVEALHELETHTMEPLLWAKAIETSGGSNAVACANYIRLRAKSNRVKKTPGE